MLDFIVRHVHLMQSAFDAAAFALQLQKGISAHMQHHEKLKREEKHWRISAQILRQNLLLERAKAAESKAAAESTNAAKATVEPGSSTLSNPPQAQAQAQGSLVVAGRLAWCDAKILLGAGSGFNMVSTEFVERNNFPTRDLPLDGAPQVYTEDGKWLQCTKILDMLSLTVGTYRDVVTDMYVMPGNCPYDLILGKPWFTEKNPEIANNIVTLKHNGAKIMITGNDL